MAFRRKEVRNPAFVDTRATPHRQAWGVRSCQKIARLWPLYLIFILIWLVVEETHPMAFRRSDTLHFFKSDCYQLRTLFLQAIGKAKYSIDIHTFALSDPQILKALCRAEKRGVRIKGAQDPNSPPSLLGKGVAKGLFHEKYCIIDRHIVILGSANLTEASFDAQDNFIAYCDNALLAEALLQEVSACKLVTAKEQITCWRLPNSSCPRLIAGLLDEALADLTLEMYTLTHPTLIDAIERAKERGVRVQAKLDRNSGQVYRKWKKWAKLAPELPLCHHKHCLIDGTSLFFGSANWTKSAFEKNRDLLILYQRTHEPAKY